MEKEEEVRPTTTMNQEDCRMEEGEEGEESKDKTADVLDNHRYFEGDYEEASLRSVASVQSDSQEEKIEEQPQFEEDKEWMEDCSGEFDHTTLVTVSALGILPSNGDVDGVLFRFIGNLISLFLNLNNFSQ